MSERKSTRVLKYSDFSDYEKLVMKNACDNEGELFIFDYVNDKITRVTVVDKNEDSAYVSIYNIFKDAIHSVNDEPAVIHYDDDNMITCKEWYYQGVRSRENGPYSITYHVRTNKICQMLYNSSEHNPLPHSLLFDKEGRLGLVQAYNNKVLKRVSYYDSGMISSLSFAEKTRFGELLDSCVVSSLRFSEAGQVIDVTLCHPASCLLLPQERYDYVLERPSRVSYDSGSFIVHRLEWQNAYGTIHNVMGPARITYDNNNQITEKLFAIKGEIYDYDEWLNLPDVFNYYRKLKNKSGLTTNISF